MKTKSFWSQAIRSGLLNGAIVIFLGVIGMIEAFSQRYIIFKLLKMSMILLFVPYVLYGYTSARKSATLTKVNIILSGTVTGLVAGLTTSILPILGNLINLRKMFINASPTLYGILLFNKPTIPGVFILALAAGLAGTAGASLFLLNARLRKTIIQAFFWVILAGLIRDLTIVVIAQWGVVAYAIDWIFANAGLSIPGAFFIFLLVGLVSYFRSGTKKVKVKPIDPKQARKVQIGKIVVAIILFLLLPRILGIFFSEILDNVGIYILMGLGLNIVIGFAGLLDLGYVAFFAIGAYVVGVLTSPDLGFAHFTFWQALPFALLGSVLAGIILGLPVLKMRGDYLAIVTLGFGEIIRILVLSDWLKPYLGGAQGIERIAKPMIGSLELKTQGQLYYLILAGILLAGFIAWRLKSSHMGRSWMAMREDEDVAQAMGINLVATKLSAFATGAFFAGLAGAVFAAKLSSAYPHSFNFLVSINALSLIIVGGMGSIPGVFVGALALMGSPDLLREFADFRYLVYGALLVFMMLTRPEGLWPEERRKLELHEASAPPEPPIEPGAGTSTAPEVSSGQEI